MQQQLATTFRDGLYSDVIETGTKTLSADQWLGTYINYNTGTTANSKAGLNGTTAIALFTRTSYPYKRTHLKIPTVTSSRFYGGFSSNTALPVTDTPLGSADSGVIVGWNSTDTNIRIYNNDGTGAAPTSIDTGLAKPTASWSYEIISDDANARFTVNIVTNTPATFSTNITTRIPGASTRLAIYDCVENTTTTAKDIQLNVSTVESKFIH